MEWHRLIYVMFKHRQVVYKHVKVGVMMKIYYACYTSTVIFLNNRLSTERRRSETLYPVTSGRQQV